MIGVDRATVIEVIDFDEEAETVVVHVRPRRSTKRRCGRCGTRAPGYDQGEGRRNWRAVDLGTLRCFLQADAPRVNCYTHGPTVAQVPWARHNAGHTRDFDDTVAWLAVQTSKTAVTELMRIAWRSVGTIITRVSADIDARVDRLEGLRRIGIDEISYKRGHRFITVVVDHDTRRLVWAAAGRDMATLNRFFEALGAERCSLITHVSADSADWIARCVATHCPEAALCADPFHIVAWATEAIDEVRRTIWNEARGGRSPFQLDRRRRARPKTSTELRRVRIRRARRSIDATLEHRLSNGLIESMNTKIRVMTRVAYGFRSAHALIALAILAFGGHKPALPGRE